MRRSSVVLLVLIALVFVVTRSAGAEPFTIDDLLKVKRVSDPQLSPDGKWIAYVITVVNKEANSRNSDVWIVPTAGGEPRRLTSSEKSDDRPRWSPDGRTIAFQSTRSGSSQIWTISAEGGEAKQVTNLPMEASGQIWSPGGKRLAFVSDVYPECQTNECNEKTFKEHEQSKVKARLLTHLLFRHWTSWKDGKRSHVFITNSDGSGEPKDVTPGDADVPPFSLGGPEDYAFSPDGKDLAFTRNNGAVEAVSTNTDVWAVSLTEPGAQAVRLTTNPAADGGPLYSPDGRFIAFRAQRRPGFESDRWQLMLFDRQSQQIRSLTENFDCWVDSYAWSPDSRKLYITGDDRGRVPIWVVSADAPGVPKPIVEGGSNSDVGVSRDGGTIVFARSTLTTPAEIYRAAADGSNVAAVTHTNDAFLAPFKLRAGEDVWYTGAAGARVHGILVRPADFNPSAKYPVLLLVHGGPQGAWSDSFGYRWNAQVFANGGYIVFMPNPRGSTGFGQTFLDEISGDWGGKVYEDLMKGADYVESLSYVDRARTGAAGASYGGYMMDWFLGHTDRFKAIVSHAGVFNLTSMYGVTEELWFPEWEFRGMPWTNPEMYDRWSPHRFVKNFKTPTLVTHGEIDFRVPIGEGLQLFTALQRMSVPSQMLDFPDEGHWINKPLNSERWYKTVLAWLDRWVKGEKSSTNQKVN